ncbi:MAG: UDP-N-acetylglucosamine 1-carboxyvinyltransferase [Desulfuromonadales bacterium]|nr:UDP-N-acetylglucosamine 1-carboxyvinyltransferase [Desulfuromonadales bacterium]
MNCEQMVLRKSRLEGSVKISGAKNSVLKLLAASLLSEGKILIKNYPSSLLDAQIHVGMLEKLGKRCDLPDQETLVIEEINSPPSTLDWDDRSIRNTLLILGALTARTGYGAVPLPGGCQLGDRSFDLHEMLLRALGAKVWQEGCMLCAEAPIGGLVGADIHLPIRSTGATENAIIAGTLAKGTTRIWGPHIRPEILDLIAFLKSMGAKIQVFGQEHIEVIGVDGLIGTSFTVMPDNMEAITWLVGTVMTKGDVEIEHFPTRDLEVAMIHLRESGAKFYHGDDRLIVRGGNCYPLEISTGPHPGINSDVQPILAAYAACANGESRIIDLRFPGRYGYAEEMAKMGLDFSTDGNLLKIYGKGGGLRGAEVKALDLRAGAALALCGLVAEGETIISAAWQVERGYNNFVSKMKVLGGAVEHGSG